MNINLLIQKIGLEFRMVVPQTGIFFRKTETIVNLQRPVFVFTGMCVCLHWHPQSNGLGLYGGVFFLSGCM